MLLSMAATLFRPLSACCDDASVSVHAWKVWVGEVQHKRRGVYLIGLRVRQWGIDPWSLRTVRGLLLRLTGVIARRRIVCLRTATRHAQSTSPPRMRSEPCVRARGHRVGQPRPTEVRAHGRGDPELEHAGHAQA